MRRITFAFVIAAGLGAVAPVAQAREDAAPSAPAPAAAPAKPAKDDPNRMVCTREHVVGTNRPKKICMTVAQRDALRDSANQTLDPSRQRANDPNNPAGM